MRSWHETCLVVTATLMFVPSGVADFEAALRRYSEQQPQVPCGVPEWWVGFHSAMTRDALLPDLGEGQFHKHPDYNAYGYFKPGDVQPDDQGIETFWYQVKGGQAARYEHCQQSPPNLLRCIDLDAECVRIE